MSVKNAIAMLLFVALAAFVNFVFVRDTEPEYLPNSANSEERLAMEARWQATNTYFLLFASGGWAVQDSEENVLYHLFEGPTHMDFLEAESGDDVLSLKKISQQIRTRVDNQVYVAEDEAEQGQAGERQIFTLGRSGKLFLSLELTEDKETEEEDLRGVFLAGGAPIASLETSNENPRQYRLTRLQDSAVPA